MVNDRDWGYSQTLKGSRCRYSVGRGGLLSVSMPFTNMIPEKQNGECGVAVDCEELIEVMRIAAAVLRAAYLLERTSHRSWHVVPTTDLLHAFSSKAQWEEGSEAVFFSWRWKTIYILCLVSEIYSFCCYFLQHRSGENPAESKTDPPY